MSYRNPAQAVDTQTGQHYANLQKTIAGSFGNYANAIGAIGRKKLKDVADAAKRKIKRDNDIKKNTDKGQKDVNKVAIEYTSINFANAGDMLDKSAEIQRKNVSDPITNQQVSEISAIGDNTAIATTTLFSGRKTYTTASQKPIGTYGALSRFADEKEIYNSDNLYKTSEASLKSRTSAMYAFNNSNNLVTTFEVKDSKGNVMNYDMSQGPPIMPDIVPDWQKDVDGFIKQGKNSQGFLDLNNPKSDIFKKGKKIYENGVLIGVMPDTEWFKELIRPAVKANLTGGYTAKEAIMLNNNILNQGVKSSTEPQLLQQDEWLTYEKDDNSAAAVAQREAKKTIIENGIQLIVNEAPFLKKMYRYAKQKNTEPAGEVFNTEIVIDGFLDDLEGAYNQAGLGLGDGITIDNSNPDVPVVTQTVSNGKTIVDPKKREKDGVTTYYGGETGFDTKVLDPSTDSGYRLMMRTLIDKNKSFTAEQKRSLQASVNKKGAFKDYQQRKEIKKRTVWFRDNPIENYNNESEREAAYRKS